MTKSVLVFGATGAIGSALIEIITKEQPDWKIMAVSRSGNPTPRLEGVTVVKGDIEDKDRVLELTRDGVDIVYCCVGFVQYERKYWADHWPIVVDNLIAASEANPQQKYVFCDNLYAHGSGKHISTSSTLVEASTKSKPAIRAMIRHRLSAHMKAQPNAMTVVGAADFFGPHVTKTSFLGDTMTGKLTQKQSPLAIGSADAIHDFCYAPDFAQALFVASTQPKAYGRFWIAPHTIRNKTLRQISTDIGKKVGHDANIQVLPKFVLWILSFFGGFMAEIYEMLSFWTEDYTVDGGEDFTREFGTTATPYEEALDALVAFYQDEHK